MKVLTRAGLRNSCRQIQQCLQYQAPMMWPPYVISPRRLCESSCGTHLRNRMHHWIKQVSCLKEKSKLFWINIIKRQKRNPTTSFQKASWLYICTAGFGFFQQITLKSDFFYFNPVRGIWAKIANLWLEFSNGVKYIIQALCFLP